MFLGENPPFLAQPVDSSDVKSRSKSGAFTGQLALLFGIQLDLNSMVTCHGANKGDKQRYLKHKHGAKLAKPNINLGYFGHMISKKKASTDQSLGVKNIQPTFIWR